MVGGGSGGTAVKANPDTSRTFLPVNSESFTLSFFFERISDPSIALEEVLPFLTDDKSSAPDELCADKIKELYVPDSFNPCMITY